MFKLYPRRNMLIMVGDFGGHMSSDALCRNNRNILVDSMKGIGIILMVATHGGMSGADFVYIFHMPLFFILSGMCYQYGKYDFDQFVINKIKHLYFPYFLVNISYYLLYDIFWAFKYGFSTENLPHLFVQIRDVIVFSGTVSNLTIATWFFKTLFWSIILYDLLNRFLHRVVIPKNIAIIRLIVLAILLLFGYLEKKVIDDYWGNIFCTMILFEIGQYVKKIIEKNKNINEKNVFLWIFILVLSIIIISKMSICRIELSQNEIVNPVFFICGAIIGFIMLYSVYMLVIIRCRKMQNILSYIGKNSVWIVTLHLFAFRIVAWMQIKYYGLPMSDINMVFIPISKPYWWILYTVVGISIPLLFNVLYVSLKTRLEIYKN